MCALRLRSNQEIPNDLIERQGNIHLKPTVNRQDHQLYLYVGELEGIYKETIQKHMVDYTKNTHLEFTKEGYLESNLLYASDPKGTHDDLFFTTYFIQSLHWLFGMIFHIYLLLSIRFSTTTQEK